MKEVKDELSGDLGRQITRAFCPPDKLPDRVKGALKMAWGRPLWDIGPFEKWLRRKFQEKGKRYLKDLPELLSFMNFPKQHWKQLRTTNEDTTRRYSSFDIKSVFEYSL
jgi:hypothetical protein